MFRLLDFIKKHWAVLTLFMLVVIAFASLWPISQLPEAPGTDKLHHLLAYALLMLPAALKKPDYWMLLALLFIGYGGAIELLQPYVNRYGEWMDMLANATGVLCGIIVAELVHNLVPPKQEYAE